MTTNLKRSKKIVLITTVPETLESILKNQPSFLSEIFTIYTVSSYGIEKVGKNEGTEFFEVNMHRGISPFKDLMSIFKLVKFLRRVKPDLVHSYTPKAGLVSAISSFLALVPCRIHTFTGLLFPTEQGFKHLLLKVMDKIVISLNTHIVCEGKGVWKQLTDAGFSELNFNIIGNGNIAGVDLSYFNTRRVDICKIERFKNTHIQEGTKTFLYVGRLNKDKGIKELITAFESIADKIQLIIVGALDCTAPPDEITLKKINANKNILNIGFMEDIRPALSTSDCLILPSYREGFPNVVLQAGAMGLPCIVTDVPGSNEIIIENVNGWIVPSKSSDSLAYAMKRLLTYENSELIEIRKDARKNIEDKFDRNYYQEQLLKFYQRVFDD